MTDRLPIKMLHDRVLVREPRDAGERRSSGGIVIPATAQVARRLVWAEVLAVGNHVRAVQVGDRVLFSPDDQNEVEIAGDDCSIREQEGQDFERGLLCGRRGNRDSEHHAHH